MSQPAASSSTGFWKEIESWKSPEAREVAAAPAVGSRAPSSVQFHLPDGRPAIVVFLRHCGCPFAEKTFKTLTALSVKNEKVRFIAISHSSAEATEQWIPQVGGVWNVEVIVDEKRDLYAQWGLGISTTWHVMNPRALYSVFRLGTNEGIWNRPTQSGTRWQMSGAFAVDRGGTVRWAHVAGSADDLPDLEAGIKALGIELS
ncbi:Fc.00g075850.m01.CDS01 [Cosmosporella sp. VM-42]